MIDGREFDFEELDNNEDYVKNLLINNGFVKTIDVKEVCAELAKVVSKEDFHKMYNFDFDIEQPRYAIFRIIFIRAM